MKSYTYIIGANSEIARELIKQYFETGDTSLCLLSTNSSRLNLFLDELQVNKESNQINVVDYDLSNTEETVEKLLDLRDNFPPQRMFVMVGYLGNREGLNSEEDIKKIFNVNVNYLSNLFDSLYQKNYLENIESIHFSSSVGADLFYKRLFDYYESKRLLNEYLESFRTKVSKLEIKIINMKIGPVYDTKMGPSSGIFRLVASSKSEITKNIIQGINGDDEQYIPSIWKLIINIYKMFPTTIQEKLKKII